MDKYTTELSARYMTDIDDIEPDYPEEMSDGFDRTVIIQRLLGYDDTDIMIDPDSAHGLCGTQMRPDAAYHYPLSVGTSR